MPGRVAPQKPAFQWRSDLLKGQTAIVTGGSDGIGAAITEDYLLAGCKVVVLGRSSTKYDSLVPELQGKGLCTKDLHFVPADMSKVDDIRRACAEANELAYGGCADILVNNAGTAVIAPFLEETPEQWDFTMNVNVRAPFLMTQECAKRMIARGKGGKIVNTSSTASVCALHEHTSYCTSKAAISGLTRSMGAELAKHDIMVNSVGPTIVLTKMGAKAWAAPEKGDPMLNRAPLGRFAEPWEMAHGVMCLVTTTQMSGQTMLLDGGITSTLTPCNP